MEESAGALARFPRRPARLLAPPWSHLISSSIHKFEKRKRDRGEGDWLCAAGALTRIPLEEVR